MTEFICWERGGGQRLIAAVHSFFSFSRLLSVEPFSIHYISHRINRERKRERETARFAVHRVCYASLAIDFKADRPSVLRIKHEENIFIRITSLHLRGDHVTPWTPITHLRFSRLRATRIRKVFQFRRLTMVS